MLFSFFKNHKKCSHRKLTPLTFGDFCPDCGKKIEISWMILRCKCCNSKRKARVIFNTIRPEDKFCSKCGDSECEIERKQTLEFFDVEFAVISKKETGTPVKNREVLQIWIEKEESYNEFINNIRLLPLLIP